MTKPSTTQKPSPISKHLKTTLLFSVSVLVCSWLLVELSLPQISPSAPVLSVKPPPTPSPDPLLVDLKEKLEAVQIKSKRSSNLQYLDYLLKKEQIAELTDALASLNEKLELPPQFKAVQDIPRLKASELSYKEFLEQWADTPIIVTGLSVTPRPWDHTLLAQHCPFNATVKLPSNQPGAFGGLAPGGTTELATWLKSEFSRPGSQYVHDLHVPDACPSLMKELTVPRYASDDWLTRVSLEDDFYRNAWPSLFIGQEGSGTGLHCDNYMTDFWVASFEGEKQWYFVPEQDRIFLSETRDSRGITSPVDLSRPDFVKYPLLKNVTLIKGLMRPGDVLFAPSRYPHQVVNLSPAITLSVNYLSRSCYASVRRWLDRSAFAGLEQDLRSYYALSDEKFDQSVNWQPQDLSWADYKKLRVKI